jgi:hypothetical protein
MMKKPWWATAAAIVVLIIVGAAIACGETQHSPSVVSTPGGPQAEGIAAPTMTAQELAYVEAIATQAAERTQTAAAAAEQTKTVQPTETPTARPSYGVVGREDVSFGNVVRIVFRIRVADVPTEDQLRQIAQEVVDTEKRKQPVNAIGFFFYLPGTDTSGFYTAGKADWAPQGKWEDADKVEAGDYSTHKLVVEASAAVPPYSPSGAAADIPESTRRQMFYDLVAEQDKGTGDERAYEVIAQAYGVDVDIVQEIAVEGATKGWPMPPLP